MPRPLRSTRAVPDNPGSSSVLEAGRVISADTQDTRCLSLGHANKALFYPLSLLLVETAFDSLGKTKTMSCSPMKTPVDQSPGRAPPPPPIQLYISNRLLAVM